MPYGDQFLTLEVILLILLLLITLCMWLQFALLRTRLSSRLTRLEERFHEHNQLLEVQAKGGREIVEASNCVVDAMNESRTGLDSLRRDVVRLADDVRGEVGMSAPLNWLEVALPNRQLPMPQAYRSRRQSHCNFPRSQMSMSMQWLRQHRTNFGYMRNLDFVHFTLR